MRIKLAAALATLPFAATANAANVYSACFYQDSVGKLPVTQLFTLKGDALRDSYGEWTYEKNLAWEAEFAKDPWEVRGVSGYYSYNFVGQFAKFAEAQGDSHSICWVTTSRDHALAWFARQSAGGRLDTSRIQDWRPKDAGVVAVSDWSGRPSAGAAEVEAEPEADKPAPRKAEQEASAADTPKRHRMTNAEADAKFAKDKAEYEKKLAEQQSQVDDYKRAQDEVARKKQEQKLAAEQAAADYQKQLAAHAETVRNQQLEYQKQLAKPADAPNAVYRGFGGPDCATARLSATQGAGTSSTTRFKEVTTVPDGRGCIAQGWWWNVAGGGSATRQ
jgi:hypothetical protein